MGVVKALFEKVVKGKKAVPGAVITIQSFDDFLGLNPHLHVLISDGCFHENDMFMVSPTIDTNVLGQLFRYMVLKMLRSKGKITWDMIVLLDKWRHTGFNVYCGPRILPWQKNSMENLARYIIRASFSQERMIYHRETGQVEYQSKDGSQTKAFDALEWLEAMCSHVPNKGEQMVRYGACASHADRWDIKRKPRPVANAPPIIPVCRSTGAGDSRQQGFDSKRPPHGFDRFGKIENDNKQYFSCGEIFGLYEGV